MLLDSVSGHGVSRSKKLDCVGLFIAPLVTLQNGSCQAGFQALGDTRR